MRLTSLLTHSVTLFVLQQIISLWFLTDFFLARDSATADRLFSDHLAPKTTSKILQQLTAISNDLKTSTCDRNAQKSRPAKFDKVVLVVIDAFGAEFLPSLTSETGQVGKFKMPFLEEAMGRNKALGFIATAASPTVTMPRIKSLISGTIPSFIDIVYNLASNVSDFHEDNLLQLAKSRGKTLVFYGDDTWLSLFDKSMFKRHKETLSFFATDYTSVDTNVTEMALPETKRDPLDWDYLILHYLGLDHIGHVFGVNEDPLIDKKLIQMDQVLQEIHSDLSKKADRTLIVVCGDHGMSREGNHGGNTPLEAETAMIFLPINEPLKADRAIISDSKRILQVDLAPTLAALTGLPIPRMSRGVVIKKLVESLWADDQTRSACALVDNLMQLVQLLDDASLEEPDGLFGEVMKLMKQLKNSNRIEFNENETRQLHELARNIQRHLLRTVASRSNPLLVMAALLVVVSLSLRNIHRASIRLLFPLMTPFQRALCLVTVLVPILMQSSTDYIESENNGWVVISLLAALGFLSNAMFLHRSQSIKHDLELFRLVQFIVCFILVATWNNLELWKHLDFGWSLPVISVLIMCNHSRSTSMLEGKSALIIFNLIGLSVFVTKMVEETSEKEVNHVKKIAWLQLISLIFLLLATAANLWIAIRKGAARPTSMVQKLATSWMWLVFLLSRSRNYPFLISNVLLETSFNSLSNSLKLNPLSRALVYLTFSSMAFFGQGNSNLFSTLDVKPAFFAQTSYHLWLAVPLIACGTCGVQIYWYVKLFQRAQGEKEQERMNQSVTTARRPGPIIAPATPRSPPPELIPEGTRDAMKDFVDMRNFLTLAFFMFVCIALRNHLFIWSVISPKLVYLIVTNTILRLSTSTISVLPQLMERLAELVQPGNSVKYKRVGV